MHHLRVDRNGDRFDGFRYDEVGRDAHVDNFVSEAEALQVLRRDFTNVIIRDLRVVTHRA